MRVAPHSNIKQQKCLRLAGSFLIIGFVVALACTWPISNYIPAREAWRDATCKTIGEPKVSEIIGSCACKCTCSVAPGVKYHGCKDPTWNGGIIDFGSCQPGRCYCSVRKGLCATCNYVIYVAEVEFTYYDQIRKTWYNNTDSQQFPSDKEAAISWTKLRYEEFPCSYFTGNGGHGGTYGHLKEWYDTHFLITLVFICLGAIMLLYGAISCLVISYCPCCCQSKGYDPLN